jgi:hypothetical protein
MQSPLARVAKTGKADRMDHSKIELIQLIVIALQFIVIAIHFIRSEIRLFYTKCNQSLIIAIMEMLRSTNTAERDRLSGVGPTALHCIPTARSQPDVLDNTPPAQARSASNTSQLAIAAQKVVDDYFDHSYDDQGMTFMTLMNDLKAALQQQA